MHETLKMDIENWSLDEQIEETSHEKYAMFNDQLKIWFTLAWMKGLATRG